MALLRRNARARAKQQGQMCLLAPERRRFDARWRGNAPADCFEQLADEARRRPVGVMLSSIGTSQGRRPADGWGDDRRHEHAARARAAEGGRAAGCPRCGQRSQQRSTVARTLATRPRQANPTGLPSRHCGVQRPRPKLLRHLTLGDLQAYQDSLQHLATASQARRLSSIKSLLSFGQKTGYLSVNVGAAIFLPKIKQTLAERILAEDEVLRMLAL